MTLLHRLKGAPSAVAFMKFSLFGVIGFAVNGATVEALSFAASPVLAEAAAFPVAVATTWALNRRFTFREHKAIPMWSELMRYALANLGGWGINWAVYVVVLSLSPVSDHYPVLGVAAGSLAGLCLNFAAARRFVFGCAPQAHPGDEG